MKGIRRPPMRVLTQEALIPTENLVAPPSRFTHVAVRRQAYYFAEPHGQRPDGHFEGGTPLLLIRSSGARARVVGAQGLSVYLDADGLAPLAASPR